MQSIVDEKAAAFHVAIIMDGNGRWATRRGLPRSAGHQAGVRAARLVTHAAPDLGVTTHCCGITSLASYGIWWRTEFG